MFTHHCTVCDRRQLMFIDQLTGVETVAAGLEVTLTCWCGSSQTAGLADLTATRTTPAGSRPIAA